MLDPAPQLLQLSEDLQRQSYTPGLPRRFVIFEPKRRVISALPFIDRIAQHFLIEHSLPFLEPWFAPQSFACRKGYGSHRALARARELCRRHTWVLRLDIQKFFPSVDHQTLLPLLLPRCPPELRWLVERILHSPGHVEPTAFYFPSDGLFTPHERPHGLPIGNLTSQIWANAMLTPVDHLLGSKLGIGSFVRYSDDVLIYGNDKAELLTAWDAVRAKCDDLRLRLHPEKCRLHRTTEPVAFLGFVLQRHQDDVRVKLRSENVRRFRARIQTARQLFAAGALELDDLLNQLRAWLAHARHGHTQALCRRELAHLGDLMQRPRYRESPRR